MPSSTTAEDFNSVQRALAGQYSIDRELGRGGMGVVYLAREVILDRPVAIKVLPASLAANPDSSARFLREARTAAKLFHPHIVPIHRVDTVGEMVFIAMGFVDGESAGRRIAEKGPMPINETIRVLRETAWALSYAHARGVVHRDIKPDNLLLERESGRTFVTDFGIAQVEGASPLTRDGQMFGSVAYMSPEQISGAAIDGRSDLYSLGIVAHVLLTGRPPFEHASSTAVLAMQLGTPAPPIASRVSGISPRLAAAIDRCLAKDPAARHESVDAFAAALADVEAPKELPPALRVWISGSGLVDAGFWLILLVGFLYVGWSGGGWWVFAAPLGYLVVQRLRQTRRLLEMGFGLADIRSGLTLAIQREAEETAVTSGASVPAAKLLRTLARVAGWTFIAMLGLSAVLIAGTDFILARPSLQSLVESIYYGYEQTLWLSPVVWVVSRIGAEAIAPSSSGGFKHRELGARLRFWKSKAGEGLASLLRRGLGRAKGPRRTDQPTEVVLGAAAASLFDALPAAVRERMPELPDVVRGLEQRATSLRARIAELERLEGQIDGPRSASPGLDDRRSAIEADVGAGRQRAAERLGIVVAALETIRLDLLRMHAGVDSSGELTANVEAASRLAVEIDRELAGRASVERMLNPTVHLAGRRDGVLSP